jgi:hypothetical protein
MFLDCMNKMPSDRRKMGMANSRMLRLSFDDKEWWTCGLFMVNLLSCFFFRHME